MASSPVERRPDWDIHLPAGSSPQGVDLLAEESLPRSWVRRWSERPSWPQIKDVDGTWWSSLELEERSRTIAGRLRGAGLVPGDRVILSGTTSAAIVASYIAVLRAGLVVVPVNTAYTRGEVERLVADAAPRAAIVDDGARADWIVSASEQPVTTVDPDVELPDGPDEELDTAGRDDAALLVYTSGTTGRPKGVPLTHGNLLASASAFTLAWRWEPADRLLLTLPLFHLHGLGVGLNGTLTAGASAILRERFDADEVLDRAGNGDVSMFFGVPTMYQRLAARPATARLGRLRLAVSGSAPLPAPLAEAVAAAAGQPPLERYGMTETVILTSDPYDGERRAGSVGLPLPGVDLRLGNDGEVQVRGPNVVQGYLERPDADADAFTDDGWFRTGDVGEHDADGYLRLVGRQKNLIITGGYNVHPREIEEALLLHPDVRDVAVVGRPSEQWGEAVTAVLVVEGRLTAEELQRHAATHVAHYKIPKTIEFTSELPRNALGKVLREQLRIPPPGTRH